jgi:hypothetical protein
MTRPRLRRPLPAEVRTWFSTQLEAEADAVAERMSSAGYPYTLVTGNRAPGGGCPMGPPSLPKWRNRWSRAPILPASATRCSRVCGLKPIVTSPMSNPWTSAKRT